jgi:hypothetical protein
MRRSIAELSIYTQEIERKLLEVEVGETITYAELSEHIGLNVQEPNARGYLYSAMRRLLNNDQIVFDCVRGVGVKRLSDEEIAKGIGSKYLKSLRAKTKKANKKLTSIQDFENLSNEAKVSHNTALSFLGFFQHMTKNRNVRKIEDKVSERRQIMNFTETLRLME